MPEYCITTKEIWHSYLYIEANDVDDAIEKAKSGEGDIEDSDYHDTIGYTSILDRSNDELTDLEKPPVVDEHDPNNIFTKSKKQKEVDKAIIMLDKKIVDFESIAEAVKVLKSIRNI
jgi:hypothetical protein